MAHTVEITTFKLTSGLRAADFKAANADVDPWLERQPGFVSRLMLEQPDGTIMDMVFWRTSAAAKDASRRLMRELADSPVHGVIDQATVSGYFARVFDATPQAGAD